MEKKKKKKNFYRTGCLRDHLGGVKKFTRGLNIGFNSLEHVGI